MALLSGGAPPYDILILSNGPGELTTWVRPVVMELRQQLPQARLSLVLSPCPHASGQEAKMAQEFIQIDRVQDPDFFLAFLLTGQTEEAWDWAKRGVVLFLGGDQFFAIWIAQRLRYRLVVYAEHQPRWQPWVDAFALRTEEIKRRYDGGWLLGHCWASKMHVVGDLMADGVASATYLPGMPVSGWLSSRSFSTQTPAAASKPTAGFSSLTQIPALSEAVPSEGTVPEPVPNRFAQEGLLPRGWQRLSDGGRTHYQVGLLPGSKPAKLSLGVPMMLAVADELRQQLPNIRFVIPVAPGQTPQSLAGYAHPKFNPDMALVYGTSGALEQTNLGAQFITPFGSTIQLWTTFPAYSVLANCDLCLTTIGANTAELARLGVPMVVVIPTNKLEAMRAWDGILGLLVNLPGIGTGLARWINRLALGWLGHLAWPNIWAGREVVPELRGHLRPVQVAEQAQVLLEDPQRRRQMQAELQQLGGKPGAAQAIVQLVAQQLSKS
ncbi:hypothetical protein [Thermostichus vulcanus]|uniref:Lipid-A-disaccharide synthase n=1 Tax=Thermostichus vulcanus str. 'Rupite' TaxID=2813851 RepID=A0ABT0C6N2_THEVL|nr:hypothetical protein [Thermostichus vulcanus]MCJ2541362.1 hypothetical protein [Thermostichus vulcanus str. 'Rupite']